MMTKIVTFLLLLPVLSAAWHDETHLAIAKAAGYGRFYNTAGPDIAKVKAFNREEYNHFFNAPAESQVDVSLVTGQVLSYNDGRDKNGHLYGAIIASLRDAFRIAAKKGFAEYHLAYCLHYIGDLSNPLHNSPYDSFNRKWHSAFDGVVEDEALGNVERIRQGMTEVGLNPDRWEADLAAEIARIANLTIALDRRLRTENRGMTKEEAWHQVALSASLCKAVLEVVNSL